MYGYNSVDRPWAFCDGPYRHSLHDGPYSASKNTDSSVFYTEIETKKLNTDSEKSDHYTANYSDLAMKK